VRPADGLPARPPRRLAPLEPSSSRSGARGRAEAWRQPARRRLWASAALAVAAGVMTLALATADPSKLGGALVGAAPVWVLATLALLVLALLVRAEAWNAILRAALRSGRRVSRGETARATMIGVLMSATLPARLGELSRSVVVARRLGRVREQLPLVAGTVVSQSLLNLLGLAGLGATMLLTVGLFAGREGELVVATLVPAAALLALVGATAFARSPAGRSRSRRSPARESPARRSPRGWTARTPSGRMAARVLAELRGGLSVFSHRRLGPWAAGAQLAAWALQWLACYAMLVALGLEARVGLGGAAAILLAVNATAALPAVPANVGVFQAACVAVLAAHGIDAGASLAYGIGLQALELGTAVALGLPALMREGMSWRELRARALDAAPVGLAFGSPLARGARTE
jgi:phosphatidyl-myo-inositol alpha-mannosyltransferase